jgi:hypothetical protein
VSDRHGADGPGAGWQPDRLRLNVVHLLVAWAIAVASVYVGAGLVPDVGLERPGGAVLVAAVIGVSTPSSHPPWPR